MCPHELLLFAVSEMVRERLTREVKVLASLDHPNIVRYHDSWFDDRDPTLLNHFDATRHPLTCGRSGASNDTVFYSGLSQPNHRSSSRQQRSSASSQSSGSWCSTDSRPPSTPTTSSSADCSVTWLYIQMELCRGGTLKNWLDRTRKDRPLDRCVTVFESVAKAIDYLHGENFMHRDIKVSPQSFHSTSFRRGRSENYLTILMMGTMCTML